MKTEIYVFASTFSKIRAKASRLSNLTPKSAGTYQQENEPDRYL